MDNINNVRHSGDENLNMPIPLGGDSGQMKVSHSPLNLGGGSAAEAPKPAIQKPTAVKPANSYGSTGRITGVKTFFTKLHAGAMEFLDEQISKWLHQNPNIQIKFTNTTTGEVQGKKNEPNIIIHVWY